MNGHTIEIWNLRFAIKFAKMFLFIIIAMILALIYCEYTRIQDTKITMAMFNRIAGNYALSASQDVDELTSNSSISSNMYNYDEYTQYIYSLELSNDASLKYAANLMRQDLNTNGIDNLHYTPMSFNLPYLSKSTLTEYYKFAMDKMVRNYTFLGTPTVMLCDNTNNLNDFNGAVTDYCVLTGDSVDGNYMKPIIKDSSEELLTSIYGNSHYFNDAIDSVLSNLNPDLYEDPRVIAYNTGTSQLITYDVTFSTQFYYITSARLLAIQPHLFTGDGSDINTVRNNINNSHGIFTYNDTMYNNRYDLSRPMDGQLMFYFISDGLDANFEYTYIS